MRELKLKARGAKAGSENLGRPHLTPDSRPIGTCVAIKGPTAAPFGLVAAEERIIYVKKYHNKKWALFIFYLRYF